VSEVLGTVRASSWPTLFDCSLRWYYQNVMRLSLPASGKARLGTALHRSTAAFDAPRVAGGDGNLDEACGVVADAITKPDEEVQWDDDLKLTEAVGIGVALTTKYATKIAPLRRYRAVEINCEGMNIATDDGVIRLTGTTDRVRLTDDGREGISDIKSGKTAVAPDGKANTKGHHLQTGIYRIMAEHALQRPLDAPDEVIGLNTAKTDAAQRVGTAEIRDSRAPLVGDADTPGMIELAARMLKTGTFPPNPKSMLCSAKYCAGYSKCRYHD
jgi:hypothetical protein